MRNNLALALRITILVLSVVIFYLLVQVIVYIFGISGGGFGGIPPVACHDDIQAFNDKIEVFASGSALVFIFIVAIIIESAVKLPVNEKRKQQNNIWKTIKWLSLTALLCMVGISILRLLSTLCII